MNHIPGSEILLIEDSDTDAELTMHALGEKGLANKIIWVKDGAEALDYIFATGSYSGRDINELPSLILLDLKLPKVDGLEVLEKLRADERTKLIPVVALSSSTQDQDICGSYKLGANSFVSKPIEVDKFVESVSQIGLYWMLVNRPCTD